MEYKYFVTIAYENGCYASLKNLEISKKGSINSFDDLKEIIDVISEKLSCKNVIILNIQSFPL